MISYSEYQDALAAAGGKFVQHKSLCAKHKQFSTKAQAAFEDLYTQHTKKTLSAISFRGRFYAYSDAEAQSLYCFWTEALPYGPWAVRQDVWPTDVLNNHFALEYLTRNRTKDSVIADTANVLEAVSFEDAVKLRKFFWDGALAFYAKLEAEAALGS